jgi:hypothetical protein
MRLSNEFLERKTSGAKHPDVLSRAESRRRLTTAVLKILEKDRAKKAKPTPSKFEWTSNLI